jgi:hypothetical protein
MFYFVIFHSSVSAGKDLDKKTLTTFLYGCVLYIIFHALLSTSDRPFFKTVQSYFWVIMAIDIVCMLYIYIKLIKPNPGDGSFVTGLKDKVVGLLDNFVDMSMYNNNDIVLSEYPINMHPSQHANEATYPQYSHSVKHGPGILKKAVSIDESMNEIREIEPVTQIPDQQIQTSHPETDQGETDEINNQLAQLTDSMMQFNSDNRHANSHSTGDRTRDLLSERAMSNLMQPKPKEVPAALQSTSVDAIRKRANSTLAAETVKTMNTKSVLENRAELSNDQLRTLSLNYNPDELVSDVLKRPKFEKGAEPNGTASSRLTKETLQPESAIPLTLNSKPNPGGREFGVTPVALQWACNPVQTVWNTNKKQDDAASVASSDVGSMLDFDMSEFAQSI